MRYVTQICGHGYDNDYFAVPWDDVIPEPTRSRYLQRFNGLFVPPRKCGDGNVIIQSAEASAVVSGVPTMGTFHYNDLCSPPEDLWTALRGFHYCAGKVVGSYMISIHITKNSATSVYPLYYSVQCGATCKHTDPQHKDRTVSYYNAWRHNSRAYIENIIHAWNDGAYDDPSVFYGQAMSTGVGVGNITFRPGTLPVDPYNGLNFFESACLGLSLEHSIPKGGLKAAFYNAIDRLPQLQSNTIANIIEICSSIKSIASGYKALGSLVESAQDTWLAYRYQYRTTVSDMQELEHLLERLYSLPPVITQRGYHTSGAFSYKCSIEVDTSSMLPINTFNLRLTAENVWDMIPYSFVADWFLRIGTLLHDLQGWLDAPTLHITQVWYSVQYDYGDSLSHGRTYVRFKGSVPSTPYLSVTDNNPSSKTITMRAADALALFL